MMMFNESTFEINDDLMVVQDEELSATSNEEANIVFAEWKADDDVDEIMQIDEQIGSNLLDDSIFGSTEDPCLSPTGPMEELIFMNVGQEKFNLPPLNRPFPSVYQLAPKPSAGLALEERLKNLAELMKRSQETRRSLTWTTPKTNKYARSSNLNGVLSSVEQSSSQLQQLVKAI
jgi:hypothetical protein